MNFSMESKPSSPATRQPWVFHPFLWAIFPVLSVQASNYGWVQTYESILPIVIMLGTAMFLWLALWPILPDRLLRGLTISLFWIPFYGYGFILNTVRSHFAFSSMVGSLKLGLLCALTIALGLTVLWRLRRVQWALAAPITTALNVGSAAVVGALLAGLAHGMFLQQQTSHPATTTKVAASPPRKDTASLPDIYFLVFDSFPRADYLRDYFGYDDTPFLDALRKQGFYVADQSHSNYQKTLLSLSATLNMQYLDLSMAPEGLDADLPGLFTLIRENTLMPLMKQQGYEIVALIDWGVTATETAQADRLIRPRASILTHYQKTLADMTPWRSVVNRMENGRWHFRVPFILEQLSSLERSTKPMYVLAHCLAPHIPHNYTANGRILDEPLPYKEGWRTVSEYLGKRIPEVTAAILARNPNSIIIIQGDHGPRTTLQTVHDIPERPWTGTWEDWIRDRTAILNAVYFPDRAYEGVLYPEITPVNTCRAILRKFLGLDYPALKDETYLSPPQGPQIFQVDAENPKGIVVRNGK